MEVTWTTELPHQHTVECGMGLGHEEVVLLRGLRIRHHSEDQYNNYGVYINVSEPRSVYISMSCHCTAVLEYELSP